MKSEQINELAKAMSLVQGQMGAAHKNKKNPFFKSDYADLGAVWEACRQLLSEHGLCVIQSTDLADDGTTELVTTLMHTSGQWIEGVYPIKAIKQDPQGIGSAITYARRYALAAMIGVITDDDDGESAMNRHKPAVELTVNGKKSDPAKEQMNSITTPAFKAPEITPKMKSIFEKNEAEKVKEQSFAPSPLYHQDIPSPTENTSDPYETLERASLQGDTVMLFGKNKGKTFSEIGVEGVGKSIWGAEKALGEGAEWVDKVGVKNVELFIKKAKQFITG